ncbi:MAG TPA: hypothetical protein VGM75_05670 [Pseudonocardiaceae bacterium]
MYIDNGDPGDSGELQIDVDGHEFTEQENYSYTGGQVMDSYELTEANGDHLVYTDEDHSGHADLVTEYNEQGDVVRQAHFESGHWVSSGSSNAPPTGTNPSTASTGDGGGTGATIMVDTPTGEHSVGPATVDTNHDGKPDTAVVTDANGDTIMYTDTNGDGQADVATEITQQGHVVIADHTGQHAWTDEQTGHLDANGQYHQDGGAGGAFDPQVGGGATQSNVVDAASDQHWSDVEDPSDSGNVFGRGVVRIDAVTGQWISPN